jgi:hypothetical protein
MRNIFHALFFLVIWESTAKMLKVNELHIYHWDQYMYLSGARDW